MMKVEGDMSDIKITFRISVIKIETSPEVIEQVIANLDPEDSFAYDVVSKLGLEEHFLRARTRYRYLWYHNGDIASAIIADYETELRSDIHSSILRHGLQSLGLGMAKMFIKIAEYRTYPIFVHEYKVLGLPPVLEAETTPEERSAYIRSYRPS